MAPRSTRGMTMLDESHPKVLDAYHRSARWLGDANEAEEAGNTEKAEKLYAKSSYWLDRYNRLTGRGE